MEAKQKILSLVRLQTVALEIRDARAVVDAAPGRIEEIEGRFRERNAEYVEVKERHDALEADNRTRNLDLETLTVSRKKFMDDLMQVQNQREYAALLKEIDTVKAKISEHEDRVLANLDELEKLREDLTSRAAHIEEERKVVAAEIATVESDVAEAERVIARATAERERIEADLPGTLIGTVKRVEHSRQGVFVAEAESGTCQACFVRVRPQAFQEIKLGARLHACGSCRRFLYWPGMIETGDAAGAEAVAGSEEATPATPAATADGVSGNPGPTGDAPSAGAVHGG